MSEAIYNAEEMKKERKRIYIAQERKANFPLVECTQIREQSPFYLPKRRD